MSDAPRSPAAPASTPAAAQPAPPSKPSASKRAAPATLLAASPAPADAAADDELLEFLGSLDDAGGEDVGEWLEFLARADVDKVAKSRRTPQAAPKK